MLSKNRAQDTNKSSVSWASPSPFHFKMSVCEMLVPQQPSPVIADMPILFTQLSKCHFPSLPWLWSDDYSPLHSSPVNPTGRLSSGAPADK